MGVNDIKWQLAWECNGADGIKSATTNGIGVAVISKRLVENEVKAEELCIIKVDDINLCPQNVERAI